MIIKQVASDWYSVYYRGSVVADFGSLAMATAYVRRHGHFVNFVKVVSL